LPHARFKETAQSGHPDVCLGQAGKQLFEQIILNYKYEFQVFPRDKDCRDGAKPPVRGEGGINLGAAWSEFTEIDDSTL
jgi:hypothetical protein